MERARADNKRILGNTDTGFSAPITLEDLDSNIQTNIPSFNIRVTQSVDPETGFLINDKKSALSVNFDEITLELPIKKGWKVTFIDSEGDVISGQVTRIDSERTLGYASLIIGV